MWSQVRRALGPGGSPAALLLLGPALGVGQQRELAAALDLTGQPRLVLAAEPRLAEVNVGADRVLGTAEIDHVTERVVEMSNGCICCTLREDLLEEVARLAAEDRFDHLLIESTGISEPMPVGETFTFADDAGTTLSDVARLDTMVTVVDASTFLEECDGVDDLNERGLGLSARDGRTIVDLLVEQAEFADVLVLNKADLVDEEQLARTEAVLRALNPAARIVPATRARLALSEILDTGRFDLEAAANAPGWLAVMRGHEQPESDEYGISSGEWSQAGRVLTFGAAGEWDGEKPGQELVFIGADMDAELITSNLDGCLLTLDELDLGSSAWTLMEDPFPLWEPVELNEQYQD